MKTENNKRKIHIWNEQAGYSMFSGGFIQRRQWTTGDHACLRPVEITWAFSWTMAYEIYTKGREKEQWLHWRFSESDNVIIYTVRLIPCTFLLATAY